MEKIFESEYRFLSILWEVEPIESPKLVQLCNEQLGWKKSTTYTVIKKLMEKGFVKSKKTVVEALIKKEDADKWASEELLERTSKGNIPAFFAAFLKDRKLSKSDVEKMKDLIENVEVEE